MSTSKVKIGPTPVQVTDGSVNAFITCKNRFLFADSPVAPTDLTAFHSAYELSVNPPYQIWVWSSLAEDTLVVTSQTV
ncbi:hypothetical protein ACN0IV_12790 [Trabulsiella odontotermitis]|uniref:hypothetical protein n=1 Tax=Trabulsiella odontotermitis TaxID=379893 RepID=UPI003ACC2A42